jgi:hypothetical protein
VLISQPPRPTEWTHFVTEMPQWKTGTKQVRAELLVFEWLSPYEGTSRGPLDRQSADTWAHAFRSVGHFTAEHTVTEVTRGEFREELEIVCRDDEPKPEGDLWRVATPQNARRWSWFGSLHNALPVELKTDPALNLYRCQKPSHVYGSITTRFKLLNDTEFWSLLGNAGAGLGGDQNDYTEYVAIPHDVTEMNITDPGPHSPNLHITPRRSL